MVFPSVMLRAELLLDSLHYFLGGMFTAILVVISTIVEVVPIIVIKVGVCELVVLSGLVV